MSTGKASLRDEIANAITHGIGALLAIVALVILIIFSVIKGTTWHVVGFSIFGATMVILYLASTLYHSLTHPGAKNLFRKFDHMAIFLMIAGTYTPFCLTVLKGWIGWTMLGVVWGLAIMGILIKVFFTGKKQMLSTLLYLGMGWIAIVAIKPLYDALPESSLWYLLAGGLCYSIGTFFFVKDKITFFHSIWHLFVLAGSAFHFFSVIELLG